MVCRPLARASAILVLLAASCACSGCLVLTLQPVYEEASIVTDPGLAGTWQAREQNTTVVVEAGEWKSYRVAYTSRGTSYAFVGYLTKIGDRTYIDLLPAHAVEEMPLLVPAHAFARLERTGDRLTVAAVDYDWMRAALRAKRAGRLDTTLDARQNVLLTSKTGDVRAWLLAHDKTTDAFREPVEFSRVTRSAAEPSAGPGLR